MIFPEPGCRRALHDDGSGSGGILGYGDDPGRWGQDRISEYRWDEPQWLEGSDAASHRKYWQLSCSLRCVFIRHHGQNILSFISTLYIYKENKSVWKKSLLPFILTFYIYRNIESVWNKSYILEKLSMVVTSIYELTHSSWPNIQLTFCLLIKGTFHWKTYFWIIFLILETMDKYFYDTFNFGKKAWPIFLKTVAILWMNYLTICYSK